MGIRAVQIRNVQGGGSSADPIRMLVTHRSGQAEYRSTSFPAATCSTWPSPVVYGALFTIARNRGVTLRDCTVTVDGGFKDDPPRSTGIAYEVELAADAPADELDAIAREADVESTIPNLLRATADVVLRNVEVGTLNQE